MTSDSMEAPNYLQVLDRAGGLNFNRLITSRTSITFCWAIRCKRMLSRLLSSTNLELRFWKIVCLISRGLSLIESESVAY
jgi:hypothetical protein